jgi:type II secretory pathway pseudopilin PulG
MKRLNKSNKFGFTLVETLLATFILVVISTMLINGFIATMGYSYQTSVYVKSGSKNYEACMDKVAEWNTYKNTGATGREHEGELVYDKNVAEGYKDPVENVNHHILRFKSLPAGGTMEDLYVGIVSETTLKNTVPTTLAFKSAAYAPKDGTAEFGGTGSDQLADNRKAIVYYPEYWQGKNGVGYGKVIVRGDYTQTPVYYDWVVSDSGGVTGEDLSDLDESKIIGEVGSSHKNYEKFNNSNSSSQKS